jgi:hypothetical protein
VVVVVVVGTAVVDVLVEVLVLVDVLVLVEVDVLVLVEVDVLVLELVVVVAGSKVIFKLIKFVHNPVDTTLIIVALLGTVELYPACNAAADTLVANGTVYPSESE